METIQVEKRNDQVTVKKLRRAGITPCNVYGGKLEHSIALQMSQQTTDMLRRTKHVGSTMYLNLEGKKIPVQIQEMPLDKYGSRIDHVAFQALRADTEVNSIAYILVKNEDLVPGQLQKLLFEVPFSSLPEDMVDTVTIDVAGMPVGTSITVADIPEFQNEAVKVKIDPDTLVLRIAERVQYVEEDEDAEESAE